MTTDALPVVPPFFGEFGIKVALRVPAVYALNEPYISAIEPGDEALYPGAEEYIVVPRYQGRRPGGHHWYNKGWAKERDMQPIQVTPDSPRERFVPRPHEPQDVGPVDVVVCPRKMRYGASKNWPGWPELIERLVAEGLDVFAAGTEATSYDVPAGQRAWDHPRVLDATLAAMHRASVVVATDAGLAHLAVLAGRPLLMVTHAEGIVAPGPVLDEHGTAVEPEYWPVKMERYREANHTDSLVRVLHRAWYDVEIVSRETLRNCWRGRP